MKQPNEIMYEYPLLSEIAERLLYETGSAEDLFQFVEGKLESVGCAYDKKVAKKTMDDLIAVSESKDEKLLKKIEEYHQLLNNKESQELRSSIQKAKVVPDGLSIGAIKKIKEDLMEEYAAKTFNA